MSAEPHENRYREALYPLLDGMKATRAVLYLMEPTGEFRLAAHYGFSPRDAPEPEFGKDHALVETCNRYRKPFFFNSPQEADALSALMERSHTAHILVAPIYDERRLAGILEARDKEGGDLFYPEDLKRVAAVCAEVIRLRRRSLGMPEPAPESTPPSGGDAPRPLLKTLPPPAPKPPLTQRETVLFRGLAAAFLGDPRISAVAFSLWSASGVDLYVGARGPVAEAAQEALFMSARAAFERHARGLRVPAEKRCQVDHPRGRSGAEITPASIAAAQSSVVRSGDGPSMLLFTLAFSEAPDAASTAAAREAHLLARRVLVAARDAADYRDAFRSLVRKLIEPGLRQYPALLAHSLSVAKLARRFAAWLRLPEPAVEQVTVAALLHDLGLRELGYDRLAQRRPLSEGEHRLARDHPAAGATILADVDFPFPIAPLVLHHHERYDGSGYPDHLRGEQIPFGARLIAIVDAFDAMTAATSYRPTISVEEALATIVSKGGIHFDPDLAPRFAEFIRQGEPGGTR